MLEEQMKCSDDMGKCLNIATECATQKMQKHSTLYIKKECEYAPSVITDI